MFYFSIPFTVFHRRAGGLVHLSLKFIKKNLILGLSANVISGFQTCNDGVASAEKNWNSEQD